MPDEQALARDIKAFQQNPGVQWVCSRAVDLYPDGSTYAPEDEMPPGIVERDVVFNKWVELGHTPPIHPASSCYRRNAIVQLGGWMALRHAGDTGLLLAANTLWQGYYIDTPGLLWRRHAAQTSSQSVHNDTDERSLRNEVMTERVAALRASRPA